MHKGRIFRRILPPALTPNYADNSHAPVFLKMRFQVERGLGFLQGEIDMEIASVKLVEGRIDWAKDFSNGFVDFTAIVTVQFKEHQPEHVLNVLFSDQDANITTSAWLVPPGEGKWSLFGDNYHFPADTSVWAEPWGPIFDLTLFAIPYSNEPH